MFNRPNNCSNPQDYLAETYYSLYQWDMDAIHANTAWAQCLRGSPDMVVAVIDTGVDLDHPDLLANLLPGIDYIDNDAFPEDGNGHGTHVAGTIAAAINQQGIVGVAPNVKILPARVLDSAGSGNTTDLAEAIRWAADRAMILNISAGGPYMDNHPPIRPGLRDHDQGEVGHRRGWKFKKCDRCAETQRPLYPGAYPPVIAVAATNVGNTYAVFSNYGSYVDIAAPGAPIWSDYLNNGYYVLQGTSMAAPHVSGLAALVWSQHPDYTAAQVMAAIETTALDQGDTGVGCGLRLRRDPGRQRPGISASPLEYRQPLRPDLPAVCPRGTGPRRKPGREDRPRAGPGETTGWDWGFGADSAVSRAERAAGRAGAGRAPGAGGERPGRAGVAGHRPAALAPGGRLRRAGLHRRDCSKDCRLG